LKLPWSRGNEPSKEREPQSGGLHELSRIKPLTAEETTRNFLIATKVSEDEARKILPGSYPDKSSEEIEEMVREIVTAIAEKENNLSSKG
jgi:hypothetical protein